MLANYKIESSNYILRIASKDKGRLLLQNKQNGKRLVFRHYEGSGEVYQKLLPISCPYLPQIMEVAGENGLNWNSKTIVNMK